MASTPDKLRVYADKEAVSRAAAASFAQLAQECINAKGRFTVALAGGSTPRLMYSMLTGPTGLAIYWEKCQFFWGDERYVPHNDPMSNYRMAREALLDHVPVLPANIHPMPTGSGFADEDAARYSQVLHRALAPDGGCFDLVLLGLGTDGHTASLFPGSPALEEQEQWVVAGPAPVEPRQRITLTYPVLNLAKNVHFLVSGSDKVHALNCAFGRPGAVTSCPAQNVQPSNGELIWWVDEAAAEDIATASP